MSDTPNIHGPATAEEILSPISPIRPSEPIQPDHITRPGQPVCEDCRKPYRYCRCGDSED